MALISEKKGQAPAAPAAFEGLQAALFNHRAGRLREAEALYCDVLRMWPEHPEALHCLGLLMHQRGKSDMSLDYLRMAVELCPDYPEAYNNLGVVLQEAGQYEGAVDCYQFALYLNPDLAEACYNLGSLLEELGEPEAAAECFLHASLLGMRPPVTWTYLAGRPRGLFLFPSRSDR